MTLPRTPTEMMSGLSDKQLIIRRWRVGWAQFVDPEMMQPSEDLIDSNDICQTANQSSSFTCQTASETGVLKAAIAHHCCIYAQEQFEAHRGILSSVLMRDADQS